MLHYLVCVDLKGATSCRTLASGGLILPVIRYYRNFVKMHVVGKYQ